MLESASLIIRQGRVYIPVNARVQGGGPFVVVEPVTVVDLDANALAQALERLASQGHPTIPPISREDWKSRKDPLLQAIGVKSWRKLAKDSASYGIGWSQSNTTIYLHSIDGQGRFAFNLKRMEILPATSSMFEIAQVILRDVQLLPSLGFHDVRANSD